MSPLLVLPAPLPSTSITLGQLITDPVYADSASLRLSQPPTRTTSNVQPKYQDTITHDEYGRFTSTCFISKLAGQAHYSHENLLLLDAEEMSHTTIDRPASAFNELRRDSTTRTFLRKMAQDNRSIYFVTGLQTLKNPSFKPAVVEHGVLTEATTPSARMPVRRVDSASYMTSSDPNDTAIEDSVLAVQLLKVKCRVGASSEPHCVSDLDYQWSYHTLDEDGLQFSIGLGKALQQDELMALAGMADVEGGSEKSWSSTYSESEDGIGGF
jgi:hypothetical protein